MKKIITLALSLTLSATIAQTLLQAEAVFDGETLHPDWVVVVQGNTISYAGPNNRNVPQTTETINLQGMTLMPGLIEGHSHLLLHPYNETTWNDQVLKESPVERAIRGTVHAKNSLMAGITTMRDLGSEGAGYTDIYLKKTIDP